MKYNRSEIMKSITINGTQFTEITYIYDGEEMPGLLIHDEAGRGGCGVHPGQ